MDYNLIKEIMGLISNFETSKSEFPQNLGGFKRWVHQLVEKENLEPEEPVWEGKEKGRSPESVISTLLVHMNRYAKMYSKSAIFGSAFSTQDEFSYLICLKAFGPMSKMDLVKKNVQDKSAGMQIITRLLEQGFIEQFDSETDKRSKIISLSVLGESTLGKQMTRIREATNIVTGNLDHQEKMELIRLLDKLNEYHLPIYQRNLSASELLDSVLGKRSDN